MELVVKTAYKETVPNFDDFQSDINSFAHFYGLQNYKKWHSLMEFEEMKGIKRHTKLFRLFPIRWAPSYLHAIQRLDSKYETLVDHLEEVANDDDFSEKAREQADELRNTLLDPNFVSLMKIQEDVLSLASYESLHYQKEGQSPIGEYARQLEFAKHLEELQKRRGPFFTKFLKKEVRCTEDKDLVDAYIYSGGTSLLPFCNTLQRFEGSTYVVYKVKLLNRFTSSYDKLSTYLKKYTDELKSVHQQYFLKEKETMELFDILDISRWPSRMPIQETANLEKLAYKLKLIPHMNYFQHFRTIWPEFRQQVFEHLCENKDLLTKRPEEFWSYVLNSKQFSVPQEIRSLIEFVIIIPSGSADAGK